MKHLNKYLSLALALVLCLSLAACGESNEDYGDDGSDYNLYGVPDSFEGLVKDSKQMSNLYLYGGAWKGEDGGTLISDTNDDGDEVRFALYDAGEELTASGFIQFVPDYECACRPASGGGVRPAPPPAGAAAAGISAAACPHPRGTHATDAGLCGCSVAAGGTAGTRTQRGIG